MKSKKRNSVGALFVVLSSFFYATYGIWTKLTGDHFGGYTASAFRSVLVVLILVPMALLLKKFEPVKFKKNWKYLFGLFFFSFFIWGPLYYAVLHAGVALSLTVNYACLALGMLVFGRIFLKERLTRAKILSIALGITGLAMTFSPDDAQIVWIALGAAALSGFASAAIALIIKVSQYGPTQITLFSWVASILANTLMAVVIGETISSGVEYSHLFYFLLFAIASVAASLSLAKGVKLIESGLAGILGLLEIVFGILFGVFLFGERPGLLALTGAVLIIISAILPNLNNKKYPKR